MMMGSCDCHRLCNGIMMLVFGVLFLLGTLGVWPEFTFVKYWPLVIIAMGFHKVVCGGCRGMCKGGSCDPNMMKGDMMTKKK